MTILNIGYYGSSSSNIMKTVALIIFFVTLIIFLWGGLRICYLSAWKARPRSSRIMTDRIMSSFAWTPSEKPPDHSHSVTLSVSEKVLAPGLFFLLFWNFGAWILSFESSSLELRRFQPGPCSSSLLLCYSPSELEEGEALLLENELSRNSSTYVFLTISWSFWVWSYQYHSLLSPTLSLFA